MDNVYRRYVYPSKTDILHAAGGGPGWYIGDHLQGNDVNPHRVPALALSRLCGGTCLPSYRFRGIPIPFRRLLRLWGLP